MKSKEDILRILQRPATSTFVCMLVIFVAVDWGLNYFQPLQHIKDWRLLPLSQNPVVSKIPRFLNSNSNADIWVMGSSLPMMAIATWDDRYSKSVNSADLKSVRTYTKAQYLKDTLEKQLNRKVSIENLTCVACMASDARIILDKAIYVGKKPKAIIYGIGPRTFVDNTIANGGKTAVEQVVSNQRSLVDICRKELSCQEIRDTIFGSFWSFYSQKGDYRDFLVSYACYNLDRAPTIYAAQQRVAAEKAAGENGVPKDSVSSKFHEAISRFVDKDTGKSEKFKADLAVYNIRYNPPNFVQFDNQKKEFSKLLSFCRAKQIQILVVAMPITDENRNLINRKLLSRYQNELPETVKQKGGKFLDLDSESTFALSDFDDSVHTNAVGGKKVQDKILEVVTETNFLL